MSFDLGLKKRRTPDEVANERDINGFLDLIKMA